MNVAQETPEVKKSKNQVKLPKKLIVNGVTYEWVKVLGKGGYATALSAKRVAPDEKRDVKANGGSDMVAIKTIVKNNFEPNKMTQVVQYAMREIDIMNRLDHQNIVKLYSHWQDQNCIYMIMELCVNKTLSVIIKSETQVLSSSQMRQFLFETAQGCRYIHDKLVIHRDLKPENILLDQLFRIKIADFGLSVVLKCQNEMLHTFCGTLKYQAPEMIGRKGYSFPIDIWALGCIAYRIYYGNAPFEGNTSEEIYRAILTKNPKFARASKSNGPVENYEIALIKSMLQKDASKRINLERLLENRQYFGALKSTSDQAVSRKRSSMLSISSRMPNSPIGQMVACLEAISNFDVNKRIRITYTAHHISKLMPKLWITEWIDINLFGFGYLFNKNIFGFTFTKNKQQMALLNGQLVVLCHRGQLRRFQVDACPVEFTKNLSILKQSHGLLIEQIEQENLSYPEMEINMPLDDLPWLKKKMFIGGTELVAIAFYFCTDVIQLTFLDNQKIFLFDGRINSLTIIKNEKILSLDLQFILDGHVSEVMQSYVTESLKYIRLLLNN